MTSDLTAPQEDEFELSVFARPFGECLCVHLGGGEWVVIDSCLNPFTRTPAALNYFDDISVSPLSVKLVVITHWDNDHVRGITEVVTECASATVAVSGALCREDHLQFVMEDVPAGAAGTTVDELRSVLRLCLPTNRLLFAQANMALHPLIPGAAATVTALSPSTDSIARGITELAAAASERMAAVPRRFKAPDRPNGSSVATFVTKGEVPVILGGDLERSSNPNAGWNAVLKNKPSSRASAVKVPHHGSEGAHHDQFWSEMVVDDPLAILTPLASGSNRLPGPEDVERLLALTQGVVLAAIPSFGTSDLDRESDKILRRFHEHKVQELRGWGHVRARRLIAEARGGWDLDLDGDARRIASPEDSTA